MLSQSVLVFLFSSSLSPSNSLSFPSLWHRMECLSRPAAKTVVRPINRPGYIQLMLRERWQSDIHWHMKHDIAHKVWGMSSVNGVLSVFRESCKHGKVLTTTGRFQSSQDVLKGDGLIGAIATWFPGSTFWWMPYIKQICKIAKTYTDAQWESCMGNLYADIHIKFSQSVLNQIWVCVPCFTGSRKFVCRCSPPIFAHLTACLSTAQSWPSHP